MITGHRHKGHQVSNFDFFGQKHFFDIPGGWRVCGENLYATHSIPYDNLESFFMAFSIWDAQNKCLGWDDTLVWCELLDLSHVPALWRGIFDQDSIHKAFLNNRNKATSEGYVVRLASDFHYTEFQTSMAKFVRANHIIEEHHNWRMRWDASKVNKMME